jgi:hypothetical protein
MAGGTGFFGGHRLSVPARQGLSSTAAASNGRRKTVGETYVGPLTCVLASPNIPLHRNDGASELPNRDLARSRR